jgi:hypothetical protein
MPKKTPKSEPRARRRRREVEDDFEVVELPLCAAPGCESPSLGESDFCLVHLGLDMALDKLQRSMRRNDVTGALLGGVGVLLFNPTTATAFGEAAKRFAPGASASAGAPSPPPPPPPPPRARGQDPWAFLGLDPRKAKAEDVKRVQRALAKLYHSDAGAAGVDPKRMAEVNAAAAACLAQLKQRG